MRPKSPRRDNLRRGQYNGDDSPPFLIPLDRVKALLQEWIKDGNLNLPYVPRPPIAEEKSNPRYCDYHRMVGHPLIECRNLRRIFHQRVQAREVLIETTEFRTTYSQLIKTLEGM